VARRALTLTSKDQRSRLRGCEVGLHVDGLLRLSLVIVTFTSNVSMMDGRQWSDGVSI